MQSFQVAAGIWNASWNASRMKIFSHSCMYTGDDLDVNSTTEFSQPHFAELFKKKFFVGLPFLGMYYDREKIAGINFGYYISLLHSLHQILFSSFDNASQTAVTRITGPF